MKKVVSGTIGKSIVLALGIAIVMPLTSYALSRTDSRAQAALQRQAGAEQPSGSSTGGSNGGTSGGGGSTAETDTTNANEETAQAMLDELIANGGPDTDGLPVDTDITANDVEEEVANVDTSSPGSGFLQILRTIFSRFTNR